ncbi:MAG: hypothetical protein GY861_16195 [bacterium]|nr:hypothetical protein [bacterium]
MQVSETLDNVVNKIDHTILSFGVFAASRVGDTMSTYYCAEEFGTEGEMNPVPRFLMEQFGNDGGAIVREGAGLLLLAGAYSLLNKLGSPKAANTVLYSAGAVGIYCMVSNSMTLCQ